MNIHDLPRKKKFLFVKVDDEEIKFQTPSGISFKTQEFVKSLFPDGKLELSKLNKENLIAFLNFFIYDENGKNLTEEEWDNMPQKYAVAMINTTMDDIKKEAEFFRTRYIPGKEDGNIQASLVSDEQSGN